MNHEIIRFNAKVGGKSFKELTHSYSNPSEQISLEKVHIYLLDADIITHANCVFPAETEDVKFACGTLGAIFGFSDNHPEMAKYFLDEAILREKGLAFCKQSDGPHLHKTLKGIFEPLGPWYSDINIGSIPIIAPHKRPRIIRAYIQRNSITLPCAGPTIRFDTVSTWCFRELHQ